MDLRKATAKCRRPLGELPSQPIAEISVALGFSSQSHFTEVFRRMVGTTPGRYGREH